MTLRLADLLIGTRAAWDFGCQPATPSAHPRPLGFGPGFTMVADALQQHFGCLKRPRRRFAPRLNKGAS